MKTIIFLLAFPISLFSAGLVITSDTNTAIELFLDNGSKRSDFVLKSKPYQTDAIFAGFSSVQWMGKDRSIYKANVNILGIEGWRSLKITDNTIYIGGNLFNKPKGRFTGILVRSAQ